MLFLSEVQTMIVKLAIDIQRLTSKLINIYIIEKHAHFQFLFCESS